MAQVKPVHKIRAAAYYFVFVSRNLKRIATDFKVNSRTITRWAKEPEWTEVLDACDYRGDRGFEVEPTRDAGREFDEFNKARDIYQNALKAGVPKHKLTALVEKETGIPRKRVGYWVRTYGWLESGK